MNERILSPQLLRLVQAAGPGYSPVNPEWVKKFAELIVAECMITVLKDELESSNAIQNAARRVKEHFGVFGE
jgi:hypothetical protein